MMATNSQKGFATLTITLVLVSMLVAVSVFVGKVLISDKRITLNEIEYRIAQAAAEKGIAEAMARLKVDPLATSLSGTLSSSAATASYTVTMEKGVPIPGVWQLKSVAILPNGSEATVSVQVAERSILNPAHAGPAAPLVVLGGLSLKGNMTVVANTYDGDPDSALSIWSDGSVTLDGNAKTCLDVGCERIISTASNINSDIAQNDSGFPRDLFEYIFGVPDNKKGWEYIESSAGAVLSSCSGYDIKDGGVYVIKGVSSCIIDSNVGEVEPVVIILKDSSLTINANRRVSGLLFAYDSNSNDIHDYTIKVNGGARFYGAMISNHDRIELSVGSYNAIYDKDVMSRLMGGGEANPFINIDVVPGSWKDW